jgi:hypothetical protein
VRIRYKKTVGGYRDVEDNFYSNNSLNDEFLTNQTVRKTLADALTFFYDKGSNKLS